VTSSIKKQVDYDQTCYLVEYTATQNCAEPRWCGAISKMVSNTTDDDLNYRILKGLVYGSQVSVNVHCLSTSLNKHRNTVRTRVKEIFENHVLSPPIFPYVGLYKDYPLLAMVWTELPYEESIEEWFRDDPHVFAAFRSRYSEYNTLIISYHKGITEYQLWRENLFVEKKLPLVDGAEPLSSASLFSNQLIIKHDPNAPVYLLEKELREKGSLVLNGYSLDDLSMQIVKLLTRGKCIKINENKLAKELGVNRKTATKRIHDLIKERWISTPVCRFPNFFTPPHYILAICKLEIRSAKQKFIQGIRSDPHVTMAFDIKEGRYNVLLFGAFKNLEEELEWEIKQGLYLPKSIGQVDIQYVATKGIIELNQAKVSLSTIDEKYIYFRS